MVKPVLSPQFIAQMEATVAESDQPPLYEAMPFLRIEEPWNES
jgi:hypothetical protein